jgi:hypothetical protein
MLARVGTVAGSICGVGVGKFSVFKNHLVRKPLLPKLTSNIVKSEAAIFAKSQEHSWESSLFGVTDGKAVGTYLERKFKSYLKAKYDFENGSAASGIDFPELEIDIKVTSIRQPQSSCPFRAARQKVYGLGYDLLVFVYDKTDDQKLQLGQLRLLHTVFVDRSRTADFQTTTGLHNILTNSGNIDDILGFFAERLLPVDEITAHALAEEVLGNPPNIGYLTISNALQWRLQYSRVIQEAGTIEGIERL